MSLHVALAVSALLASAVVFFGGARILGGIALAASGLEAVLALRLVRLHLSGVPLGLVLALGLAVPGLVAWARAGSKTAVTASAVVALAGVLQALAALQARL